MVFMYGSRGRDRTYDQLINSQLHYRCATLEYLVPHERIELPATDYKTVVLPLN